MKRKHLLGFLLLICSAGLISWAQKGHEAVGAIAQNHLSLQASTAIRELLDTQSLADVSTWADDVKSDPQYNKTASWHYLNLPIGLDYDQFIKAVKDQGKDNIYSALERAKAVLQYPQSTKMQKLEALKFIVHFVGDAHQPMHVSRAEDKGGNTIKVRFEDKSTNLHSLWDSKLIDHQGLSVAEMAKEYDKATSGQIKEWQGDQPMKWLFESYKISTQLYAEVADNNNLDEDYYKAHIAIVEKRIDQAGIRLAGMLNEIFDNKPSDNTPPPPLVDGEPSDTSGTPVNINLKEIASHINEKVTVTGKVYGMKDFGSMTLVNLGAPYPDHLLTVVLRNQAKDMGGSIDGKTITVTGRVIDYKGKPEIIVTDVTQITIN